MRSDILSGRCIIVPDVIIFPGIVLFTRDSIALNVIVFGVCLLTHFTTSFRSLPADSCPGVTCLRCVRTYIIRTRLELRH